MKHPISSILILCVLGFSLLIAGCNTPTTNEGYEMAASGNTSVAIVVPPGVSGDEVETAVENSLIRRGWIVTSRDDNQINATLNNQSIQGRIVISYTDERVTVTSESMDSEGKPFVPIRWINFLRSDIESHLSVVAGS